MTSARPIFMYNIAAGVLQGCPLSAILFVIILDPFLRQFDAALGFGKFGIIRACADDIAAVLYNMQHLDKLANTFPLAEMCANLKLKPSKCKLIPCVFECF